MPTFEEARKIVLDATASLGVERVELLESRGRVIAEDIAGAWDMPLCDNSAMDGFAVRAADCAAATPLKVTGYIPAGGEVTGSVEPGCAIRIMTGAPIPPGCDAVVPVEETEDLRETVRILSAVEEGQHIRRRGEDVAAGQLIITRGTVIRPPEISMLASFGKAIVPVYRRPRVAVLSTGDELIELGEPPVPGKIINSNTLSIAAAVSECGGIPVILGIARDDRQSLREKIAEGLLADALITSAGVSAGDRDLVREVLEEMGVKQQFWKVEMKPGGPTAFATYGPKPVFSLPGNPVSTMVTFDIFVRPALLKMSGRSRVIPPTVPVVLGEKIRKKRGKTQFIRLRLELRDGKCYGWSSGNQHTGILRTMMLADAMAVLPADRTEAEAGEEVAAYILRDDIAMLKG